MATNDSGEWHAYPFPMPRKAPERLSHDWFLPEWMAAKRVSQAEMARMCGWSKATMNDIFHGKTAYYRDILVTAASALQVEPFQLLLPPERAYKLLQLEGALIRQVAEEQRGWRDDSPPTPFPGRATN